MWEPLRDLADQRFRSPRHESRWYNLAGYCLRPGTGFPLDEVRIKALWPVFHLGVKHVKDLQCWAEWWILWRRVAAGLSKPHHDEIARRLTPFLLPPKGGAPAAKKASRPRPEPHEVAEMWRCAASLERLMPELKESLGEVARPRPFAARPGQSCPLVPGTPRRPRPAVRAGEYDRPSGDGRALDSTLLDREYAPGRETADAVFALSQLARVSGDRTRDVEPELRERVADRLARLGASEDEVRSVREYTEREAAEQGQALGDALPVGLRLIGGVEPAGV